MGEEARVEGQARSKVVRLAIVEYLDRRERERFMAEMASAARALADDAAARQESLEIANDLSDDGLGAIAADEQGDEATSNVPWWR